MLIIWKLFYPRLYNTWIFTTIVNSGFYFFASQLETVIQEYWSKKLLFLLPFQCQCHFQKCFPFSSLTLPICLHFWFGDDMNKINPKQPYLNIILSQTFMSWLRGMKQTFWISIINPYCERDCTQEYESPYFFIISSFLNFPDFSNHPP